MNEIIRKAFEIDGLFAQPDAEFLIKLAARGGELVEIGCYKGRTTALILQACKPHGGKLTSIDPFIEPGKTYKPASPDLWRDNLKDIGLKPPELLHMTSDEALPRFQGKELSMVFIDGCHGYDCVISDLVNYTPLLKIGGVVVLHDMWFPDMHGVCKAVVEWFSRQPRSKYAFIGQAQYTIAFERRKA